MPPSLPTCLQKLSGWGNYPASYCLTYRPEKQRNIPEIYISHKETLVARGNGMSYGDAALNPEGTVDIQRLNRFLAFDKIHGTIKMQAGVLLSDILDICVPHGWFLPVIPGTKYASVGGCIASNVHGKNHYKRGDVGRHVVDLSLRLANGELVHCSPHFNSDIFWATAGGMGMTGTIEEVTLQLTPISTDKLATEAMRVETLEEMVGCFEKHLSTSEYLVGWIDHFAKGKSLGRGVFERANHVKTRESSLPDGGYTPVRTFINPRSGVAPPTCDGAAFTSNQQPATSNTLSIPCFAPGFLLNKYSMALYNAWAFRKVEKYPTEAVKDFDSFFHPLDRIGHWNRLYGKRGFFQYQCLVPRSPDMVAHLHHILETIQENGLFSFLAVLKYHGPHEGMLSFPMEGFSLALDFPNTKKVRQLLDTLDEFIVRIGGRVYLAKDARMKKEHFEAMYAGQLPKWREMLKTLDPQGKHCSDLARRLHLREG